MIRNTGISDTAIPNCISPLCHIVHRMSARSSARMFYVFPLILLQDRLVSERIREICICLVYCYIEKDPCSSYSIMKYHNGIYIYIYVCVCMCVCVCVCVYLYCFCLWQNDEIKVDRLRSLRGQAINMCVRACVRPCVCLAVNNSLVFNLDNFRKDDSYCTSRDGWPKTKQHPLE